MRKLLIVGIVLAIIGITVVALPFGRPEPQLVRAAKEASASGAIGYVSTSSRCSAPIISAWHRDSDAGWFGYTPLTSTDVTQADFPTCKPKARRRLAGGVLFVACGVAVAVVALRRRRDAPEVPPETLPGGGFE